MTNTHPQTGSQLDQDLARLNELSSRRDALVRIGLMASLPLSAPSLAAAATCAAIPSETAGPYPAHGTLNFQDFTVVNVLNKKGIVRSDITRSFGTSTVQAPGVPMNLRIKLKNKSCVALKDYAIYLWQCDALGLYSLYSTEIKGENYLRGVQVTDANGEVNFTTIVPGCYKSGSIARMPHFHFEVFKSASKATSWTRVLKTSQLALPNEVCTEVYTRASGYEGSWNNFQNFSFEQDGIFSDGVELQMIEMNGDVSRGYDSSIEVAI